MSFNIFGPASKDDIRVGYISPDRGFVDSISICEANDYAFANPGTIFIFRTRDKIRYLDINEVNALTPKDLEPKQSGDTCTGINVQAECDPIKVSFLGGGGVGVVGNPVFGEDGSLLAVDLIHGGYGYQYPPITELRDNCGRGSGAVLRSVLGEVAQTYEYYDQEDDFEDYKICDPDEVGFGRRYDENGNDIGPWNPYTYTNLSEDPIKREIEKYQEFLLELPNPWWTTRKEDPLSVVSSDITGRVVARTRSKNDVTDETYRQLRIQNEGSLEKAIQLGEVWNEFMNTYAISPVPPSNIPGTDFSGTTFTMEWEENFPYDGDYVFKGCADAEIRDLYFDDQLIMTLTPFNTKPAQIKKRIQEGVHKIKLIIKNDVRGPELSWNTNPVGVSLVIVAPQPPIPQEPAPEQEGRCPPNPIWSTRFPGAAQQWYPVNFSGPWSDFMNRYAISPIAPFDELGTDGGGVVYKNSWNIDLPYDGFYGVRGTRDNFGRLLIDGVEISKLDGFTKNAPKTEKVFLTKGSHRIEVEVENEKRVTTKVVEQKVFDTKDWTVPPAGGGGGSLKLKFVGRRGQVYLEASGGGGGEATFLMDIDDNPNNAGIAASKIIIKHDKGDLVMERSQGTFGYKEKEKIEVTGSFTSGKTYGPIEIIGANQTAGEPEISGETVRLKDGDGDDANIKLIIKKVKGGGGSGGGSGLTSGTTINGVTYTGNGITALKEKYSDLELAMYRDGFLSPYYKDNDDFRRRIVGGTTFMKWTNVDFPETSQYIFNTQVDDNVTIRIDGVEIGRAELGEGIKTFYANLSAGKKTVELELVNSRAGVRDFRNIDNSKVTFTENPVYVSVRITRNVQVVNEIGDSWTSNPVGISAILIPPPCPRLVGGKGVVIDVLIDDPGNGYPKPPVPQPDIQTQIYPVSLRLKDVLVEDPGINYNCGVDQIQITPSNGAVLDYECDTFGRIRRVKVLNPGLGFTRYPEITISTLTGINATFRPQFEVVRDPIVIDPEQTIIQVTDLVGLKQTGYVDGRPYYGSVFYKEGVRYAGFYETPGELVQVYATLQESIDGLVTTPPSAIQRQGTDVTSNDPRLNIPGTPDNLI